MGNSQNRYNLSFIGVQCFIWSGIAFYYPFFVPYLKSIGYDEINIGVITAVLSLVGIAGPILWGTVIDRLKSAKALLVINLLAGCIAMQFIPAVAHNYGLLLSVLSVVYLVFFPMTTAVDAWVMRLKSHGAHINYGLSRGMGSLAYAVTSTAGGLIITRFGLGSMFRFTFAIEIATVLCILFVKKAPEGEDVILPVNLVDEQEMPILKNRPYIVFVLLTTLLYIGNAATMNFYWILLQSAGGTTANMGLALGVCALSEFPVMFLSTRLLTRFRDTSLLLFAMGFYAVRIFLFFFMHSVGGLVWAQLTNSLSYGLFLPASFHYISRITPGRAKATALSLASSMYIGVSGILGNLSGGFIIHTFGIRAMYGGAGVLAIVVTVAFGAVQLFSRNREANQKIPPYPLA